MPDRPTLGDRRWPRTLSFFAGLGMAAASTMTIRHFFLANYPASIYEGSFCDISSFFNCDSSAFSVVSQVAGVPLGYFGLIVGALVALGALYPSRDVERTNKSIALMNLLGVIALLSFSVFYLKSLCLLCAGYYLFSIFSFVLLWKYGIKSDGQGLLSKCFGLSMKHAATYAVVTLLGAYAFTLFHEAKKEAQVGGDAARIVKQYYSLPKVKSPSVISPFLTAQSTERFEDAPIRVIEYADFLCPDCKYLTDQLARLKEDFRGKINVAFQFFPLDAQCNSVVDKNKHPGACDLSYISSYDPDRFKQIHDEIFANLRAARNPDWRRELAKKHGVEPALSDPKTIELVLRIINTGAEYEKTSEQYAHGIRSTPTMILNNRMIIGTLPYAQLRAIFQALVDEREKGGNSQFLENWVPPPRP